MCGIVLVAGAITAKEEKLFRQLLIIDSLRGEDSTGVASVASNHVVTVAKQVGNPFELFEHHKFREILKLQNRVLIGHNRFATQGKVNRLNAHPFEFSKVVGVHNGTLSNKYKLHRGSQFEVDSEAFYDHINEKGLRDAIETAQGAYALVWYNKVEKTLNLIRNKERTFYYAFSEDNKVMFGCSEANMLALVLGREGYKIQAITALPEDTHFSYEVPVNYQPFEKAKVKVIKQTTPFSNDWKGTGTAGTNGNRRHISLVQSNKNQTLPDDVKDKVDEKLIGKFLRFTAVYKTIVENGARCVVAKAEGYEGEFRIYFNKMQEGEDIMKTKHFRATVNSIGVNPSYGTHKGSPYYKLSVISYVPGWTTEAKEEEPILDQVLDDKGKPISRKEFNERYYECQWCSSNITYGEAYRPYAHDQAVCAACAKDEEVSKYLN